jgi:hypothetical protein
MVSKNGTVAPAAARVNAILDDVKGVTSTVREETGRLDRLLEWIVDAIRPKRRQQEDPPTRAM